MYVYVHTCVKIIKIMLWILWRSTWEEDMGGGHRRRRSGERRGRNDVHVVLMY